MYRADLALLNANVYSLDEKTPRAEAIFARDGRIVHVGSNEEVQELAGDAPVLDAGGKTVVPGFIDGHAH